MEVETDCGRVHSTSATVEAGKIVSSFNSTIAAVEGEVSLTVAIKHAVKITIGSYHAEIAGSASLKQTKEGQAFTTS